jgi:hypothetical protein
MKMVNKLLGQGIEVQRMGRAFTTSAGFGYPAGSFVVSMAQPKMGVIRYLLGRTFYPDNSWTRDRDGSPIRPYDMATDTMFEFMGVRVDPLDDAGELRGVPMEKVATELAPAGKLTRGPNGYSIDGRQNDAFRAVNLLFDKNVAVRRVDRASGGLRPGDFVVGPGSETVLEAVAKQTGVDFTPLASAPPAGAHDAKRLRIAMYQRFGGGNMDEGWTRLTLEQFQFPYTSIFDPEIKKGGLNAKYDVLIFPNDSTPTITGEAPAAAAAGGRGGRGGAGGGGGGRGGNTPPEYRTGLAAEGVAAVREFVQKGGTLVTLNGATAFAIDRLGIGVRNVLTGISTKEFWCPGSTLKVNIDPTNPIAYGMPSTGLALYLNSPAFEVTAQDSENYDVPVRYAERELLQSGWLIGEEKLAKRGAVVSAKLGEGRVVLIGFPAQHRSQTHGTYKLLFNALVR